METKHTPGPWSAGGGSIQRHDGQDLAEIWCGDTDVSEEEDEANCRLMAAAPEMSDALVEVCETCESSVCGSCSVGRALHKAGITLELWDGLAVDDE